MTRAIAASRPASALDTAASASSSSLGSPVASARFYRPELDVVRFLAFLLVFLTHSLPSGPDPSTSGFPEALQQIIYGSQKISVFGLSLFFTLSAYLICELLLRERDATGTVQVKQFYFRRILRIWPLYFAGLAISLIFATHIAIGRGAAFAWVAWSAVLLGNWFIVFHGYPPFAYMNHLWSISVEEQFYLFAPWIIKSFSRRALTLFSIALLVMANALFFVCGVTHAPENVIWFNSFAQFENFAAGILLCLLLRGRSPKSAAWIRLSLIAAWALCWCGATFGFGIHAEGEAAAGSWSLMGGYGLVALGCCLLLVAFLGLDSKLLPRWAVYFGRISYGLYVFHMLANHFVYKIFPWSSLPEGVAFPFKLAAEMGMTILLASLSYRYFESPFLRVKKRHEVIESRPV
jgi:peptidoglycan/LPS O-acetylase OafA/YrhL